MEKKILCLVISVISLMMFSTESNAQDMAGKKAEVIIKRLVDGKVEMDTTVTYDNSVHVKWFGKNGLNGDVFSVLGDSMVFNLPDMKVVRTLSSKSLDDAYSLLPDSLRSKLKGNVRAIKLHDAGNFGIPARRGAFNFIHRSNENVIDLSDEDIISYKKTKKSGGREKIVIMRKEKTENAKAAQTDVFQYHIDPDSAFPAEMNKPKTVRELELNGLKKRP